MRNEKKTLNVAERRLAAEGQRWRTCSSSHHRESSSIFTEREKGNVPPTRRRQNLIPLFSCSSCKIDTRAENCTKDQRKSGCDGCGGVGGSSSSSSSGQGWSRCLAVSVVYMPCLCVIDLFIFITFPCENYPPLPASVGDLLCWHALHGLLSEPNNVAATAPPLGRKWQFYYLLKKSSHFTAPSVDISSLCVGLRVMQKEIKEVKCCIRKQSLRRMSDISIIRLYL